jgi:hypothetical protein
MKIISEFTEDAWVSGDYVEDNRPQVRATISKWHMDKTPYALRWADSASWKHDGTYRSALFGERGPVRELRNIKSIKWDRSVDTDVATCTIVIVNQAYRRDTANPNEEEFEFPGWYTPNRGDVDDWDYASNSWKDWLLPDRVIHTWEGYGADRDVNPWDDQYQYPSGVWLIDDVTLGTDGLITLTCRDLGRLLLDQIMFPPIVPWDAYPLFWEAFHEQGTRTVVEPDSDWLDLSYGTDSNTYVFDAALMDGDQLAVTDGNKVWGHRGQDACDADPLVGYWLSAGSVEPNNLEWIEFEIPGGATVEGVKINPHGGPYKVYISVYHETKGWRGAAKIPYEVADDGVDNEAGIRYVASHRIGDGESDTYQLPRKFNNVTKIRLTFASRWRSGVGERHYRVGLQNVRYATGITKTETSVPRTLGNYGDYSDIVKWLCSWAGFYWPPNAKFKLSAGEGLREHPYNEPDDALAKGRAWGDFQDAGTTGIVKLDVEMWDKKPVMDGINAVRETLGFDFWVDETGAIVWRMPNVWKKGNYVSQRPNGFNRLTRTQTTITIDERVTLIDLSVKLSSKNVRERIVVADVNGNFGTVVKGYNPAPTGQSRVAGWTDGRFKGKAETRRMAELIAIRQAYSYRQNTLTIAANPAIQVDDQILIKERITGESYRHRVQGIACEYDAETGRWVYNLTTQWLGEAAFTNRAWEPPELSGATKAYLDEMDYGDDE